MSAGTTRERIIDAAEALIAERGLDAVSLRMITTAASTGNASAIQYHFGDRAGLIRAVLARRRPDVESRRHVLLDHIEASGAGDLRELSAAFVRPLAAELNEGAGYLQLLADLAHQPTPTFDPEIFHDANDSVVRWRAMVKPLMDPQAVRLHRRLIAMQFTYDELARRARERAGRDHQLFISQTIDLVAALLDARLSDETRALAVARRSRRT
jgi:AcrR family transcriptional regulator